MSKHGKAADRLAAGALVSDILGFCFMMVGVFGPAWFVTTNRDGKWWISEGIWFASYCKNDECKTSTREKFLQEVHGQFYSVLGESHWKEFKVLSILAITGSFIAIVSTATVLTKKSKRFRTHILIISGLSACSSCMFLLVPVLKATSLESTSTFGNAWTKILAIVGVIFHMTATLIQVFAVYKSCRNYCEVKRRKKRHARRLLMVEQFLNNCVDCTVSVTGSSTETPVLDLAGQSCLQTTQNSVIDQNEGLNDSKPFCTEAELPEYAEICGQTISYNNSSR